MALEVHGLIMVVKAIKIAFSKKNNWIFEYGNKNPFWNARESNWVLFFISISFKLVLEH